MKDSGSRPFEAGGMYPEAYTREFWDRKSGYLAGKIFDELHPARVLDIGCAMGYLVEDLRVLGIEAYGCDISRHALKNAPARIKDYLFEHDIAGPELLSPPFAFYDLVVCSAIPYIEERYVRRALNKIHRVAEKWLLFFAYYGEAENTPTDKWRKIYWTLEQWNAILAQHGFKYLGDYLYEKAGGK